MTLQFDVCAWKTIGHLFYSTSSFVHIFVAIGEFKLELQSGIAQSGSNSMISRALWPWYLTYDLEKQQGTSSQQHQTIWIISSYVNSNWSYSPETAKLDCDLCDLDIWSWPFAWTSLQPMAITPEKFVMIRLREHSQKGVTDRQTETDRRMDGRTDWTIHRASWSQLKIILLSRGQPLQVQSFVWQQRAYPPFTNFITMGSQLVQALFADHRSMDQADPARLTLDQEYITSYLSHKGCR